MAISGIILAGGKSKRMGSNKALLKIGGIPLIERVARSISGVCSEIIIAGGDPNELGHLGYPVVPDVYPGCGPLSGLHSGLQAARNQYSFVSACDTPFLEERFIRRLVSNAMGYEAVIFKAGEGFYEPLCSLYGKNFAKAAETSIKNGIYKIMTALSLVRWRSMMADPDERTMLKKILFNINTPIDYNQAKKQICNSKRNCCD